jgi:hypothetical protein
LPARPLRPPGQGTDTTRTIASLVFSGAAARFRDVQLIFLHGGGTRR